MKSNKLFLPLIAFLAAPVLWAQGAPELSVNEQVNASAPLGRAVEMKISSLPGAPASLAINLDAGPSLFMGVSIPLRLDSGLVLLEDQSPLDSQGMLLNDVVVPPNRQDLLGLTLHAAAVVADPSFAVGFAAANAASFTFVPRTSGGADTAGLVNEPIVVNASDTLTSGAIGPNDVLLWEVASAPQGANLILDGADTLFPTFTSDTPAEYFLRFTILAPGTTGGSETHVRIDVHDIDFNGRAQGDFDIAVAPQLDAELLGPVGTVSIDGGTAGLTASETLTNGDPFTKALVEIFNGHSNQRIQRGFTLMNNPGANLGSELNAAAVLHFRDDLFTPIEDALATALGALDLQTLLNAAVTAIPPTEIINQPAPFPPGVTALSATIAPTSFALDPVPTIDVSSTNQGLLFSIGFTNASLVSDLSGVIFNVPYMDVATLDVAELSIAAEVAVSVNAMGELETTLISTNVGLDMPSFTTQNGTIPAALIQPVIGALVPVAEGLITPILSATVVPLLDTVISTLPTTVGITDGLEAQLEAINYQVGGTSLVLGGEIDLFSLLPLGGGLTPAEQSALTAFSTPNPAPASFSSTVPGTTEDYRFALSLSDDVLNRGLAAARAEGILDQSLPLSALGGTFPQDSDTLAFLFPGFGFEALPNDLAVRASISFEIAPVVSFTDGAVPIVSLDFSDAVLSLEAQITPDYWASVLRLGVSGSIAVETSVDIVNSQLNLASSGASLSFNARSALPDFDLIGPGFAVIAPFLTPIVEDLIDGIPPIDLPGLEIDQIPNLMGTNLLGLSVDGIADDYLTLYFD